jgi:hypothetical protein
MIDISAATYLDSLKETVYKMQFFFDQPGLILVVDPSPVNWRQTMLALQKMGYFNIKLLKNINELSIQLKMGKPCELIILDGDNPAFATFAPSVFFEKTSYKKPKTIFLKEKVEVDSSEIFRKVGALGCIEKPFDIIGFCELLNVMPKEEMMEGEIEFMEFGGSYLLKLKGIINSQLISEISEHLTCFAMSEVPRCILDCSKMIKIEPTFEKKVKSAAAILVQSQKTLEVFDPKNRLAQFNLENVEAIEFV